MTKRLARASNLEAISKAHPFSSPKESKEEKPTQPENSERRRAVLKDSRSRAARRPGQEEIDLDVHSGAAASAPREAPKKQVAAELKKRKVRREPKGTVLKEPKGVLNSDEVQMMVEK